MFNSNSFKSLRSWIPILDVCSIIVSFLALSSSAFAQISIDSLGTDTSQNERYQCVRYSDFSLNSVSIIDSNNQESSLSIAQAKKRVKKSIKRANNRRSRVQKKLKRLKQQLRSIKTKLLPRPGSGKKIKKLKAEIKRTKKAVNIITGQRRNLIELQKKVAECGKEEALTGGLIIRTVTYPSFLHDGQYTSYHIGIFFNMVRPVSRGESFCVKLDNSPFVKRLYVTIDPCPARFSDNSCAAQHSGVSGLAITGVTGTDYAGGGGLNFCAAGDPDYRCDIAAAQAEAARLAGEIGTVVVLGKADSSRGCERFE